ncbi:MAG: plastocyanin/azurin family copper-binding protein [Actinomycetota bacterium]|nr:plastocyanin/azurin family copper-binding protein [Actinomycetota bacterium]
MTQKLIAIIAAFAVGLAVTGAALSRPEKVGQLKGTVGPSPTIKLTKNGKKVKTLKAGTYRIAVSDRSSFHSFELEKETGKKVEKEITGVNFTGNKSIKLRLTRGQWKYYCKPHKTTMVGTFKVT